MKSRIWVWTIVGLVVIAGVLFLVLTPRAPKTKVDVKARVERAMEKIAKLRAEVAEYKTTLAPAHVQAMEPKFAELEQMIKDVEAKLTDIDPTAKAGYEQLREAQKALGEVRREFREVVEKGPKVMSM